MVPTRRLALAAALVAPAWLLPGTAGVVVGATLLGALVAAAASDWLRAPGARDVEVARELPDVVGLGDRAEGAYRVTSRWPRALTVTLLDALPPAVVRLRAGGADAGVDDESHEPPATAVRLPPLGAATVPAAFVGRARGRHALGPAALRVEGALGLVARVIRVALDDEVTVAPSLAGVRRYRLLAAEHRLREAGLRALRRRGEGTSFASLREYLPGDDPRHVDWKATARRGKPITREYAVEQRQTVIVAVDAGRLMTQLAAGDPPQPRFEFALASATLLADVAVQSGDNVGLLLFDDEVRAWVPPASGADALRRVRSALVPARATLVEPDYETAFRTLAARQRRRALVVLFTDVIDARASQVLVAVAGRSASRHLPLVVALRNDSLVAASLPAPDAPARDAYAAAAAEELLSARDEALARMRRAGVDVVDVAPAAMAAAVVNRYLEIKARGAL
ncbi:protein of unknown function DUF58 [Gemmatirosa kalamazoonensis]|uniref:VWFA domain-containing protein n=1 Tax=Gemmatirosa kalamazoonensis TaxID=861299 RepID=W0RFV3_9BACT|nr:protein of unknown function DUF58 [Gemmatirosa kalamazoonensis]